MTEYVDFYKAVIETDQSFINFMDKLNPGWQDWPYLRQRMFAKQFKFAENYGMRIKPQ